MVDYIRVDHFRGFEQYYAIPYGEETAMHGKWKKGPNEDLFLRMQEVFGKDLPIWAEDLGIITPRVEKLRDDFNLPGMKVLQFAFGDPKDNDILPHRFTTENCICYTGTHDNDTLMGWMKTAPKASVKFAKEYLNLTEEEGFNWGMMLRCMGISRRYGDRSDAGSDRNRFRGTYEYNRPHSAVTGSGEQLQTRSPENLQKRLYKYMEMYGRLNKDQEEEEETKKSKFLPILLGVSITFVVHCGNFDYLNVGIKTALLQKMLWYRTLPVMKLP